MAACILLYYFTQNPLFSVAGFVFLVAWIASDLAPGKLSKDDLIQSAKEVALALVVAFAIWVSLQYFLSTPTPLDVVTSCSMVPALQRGDLIILSGSEPRVPAYNFSGSLEGLVSGLSVRKNACTVDYYSGEQPQASCTNHFIYNGTSIPAVTNNDVVVYDSQVPSIGLVVHRAVAAFSNGTSEYYFTKGDNNPNLDQESFLPPVPADRVEGHVIGRIPLLGYLKLFMFLQFSSPAGCDFQLGGQ